MRFLVYFFTLIRITTNFTQKKKENVSNINELTRPSFLSPPFSIPLAVVACAKHYDFVNQLGVNDIIYVY